MGLQEVLESLTPLLISYSITFIDSLTSAITSPSNGVLLLLLQVGKLHLDLVMDFLVILEYDVILRSVLLVPLYPRSLQLRHLSRHLLILFLFKLWFEGKHKVLNHPGVQQCVLVLLDLGLFLLDLGVQFLDLILLLRLLLLLHSLLLDFLLTHHIVSLDKQHKVTVVFIELFSTEQLSLISSLTLHFKLLDFLVHRVACKLSKEHLFLLVNEFIDVLSSLVLRELHTRSCNMHGLIDSRIGLLTKVRVSRLLISRINVSILDSDQRSRTCGSILVPDFQMFGCLLLFLALLFLGFTRHKDLLVIGRSEG